MTDNATNAVPGLLAADPQQGQPITAAVKHQPRHHCQASPGTGQHEKGLAREDLLYELKGGSLRSPPRRLRGGRRRPSSPARSGSSSRKRSSATSAAQTAGASTPKRPPPSV